jgi:hypothetical protein
MFITFPVPFVQNYIGCLLASTVDIYFVYFVEQHFKNTPAFVGQQLPFRLAHFGFDEHNARFAFFDFE